MPSGPRLDPLAMISANRSVMAFDMIWLWERAERLPDGYAALEAMRLLQSGQTTGKVVLKVAAPG